MISRLEHGQVFIVIVLFVMVSGTGCTTSRIDVARHVSTGLESDTGVVP